MSEEWAFLKIIGNRLRAIYPANKPLNWAIIDQLETLAKSEAAKPGAAQKEPSADRPAPSEPDPIRPTGPRTED